MATRTTFRCLLCAALFSSACGGGSDSPTTPPPPPPPTSTVATVTVTGTASLQAGGTTQLTAVAKDASGSVVSTPVTWSSSSPTLIAVSNAGLVTAAHIATATITATADGKSGSISITSALTPFTFDFDPSMTADEQQRVKDAVQFAQSFYLTYVGRNVQKPATIKGSVTDPGCQRPGSSAFTGAGVVTLCIAQQGWTLQGPIMKTKVAIHETFHLVQFEMGWLGGPNPGPDWIAEGSAELLAFHAIDAEGLLAFDTGKGCQVKQVSDFTQRQPPGLPPLSQLETHAQWQGVVGPAYSLAYLGMDQLTSSGAGVGASIKAFGNAMAAGQSYQAAATAAFGTSPTAFYAQFPAYETALPVPPNFLCGI
jgi:hypothetical protein